MSEPVVAVFAGGTSAEREVSLGSGAACARALARSFPTRLFNVTADALPAGYDPSAHVVFSTLHGTFGEDGGMQGLIEAAGGAFSGSDARSSALAMDKEQTKGTAAKAGVRVADGVAFGATAKPAAADLVRRLGGSIVLKPNNEGSSVGLHILEGEAALGAALSPISSGRWIAERRIIGREVSVGILGGRAVGTVEVSPKSGVFDYASKYTKGASVYTSPASLDAEADARLRAAALAAFRACGCRDYARIDFIVSAGGEPFLLEINTLPGMKETSLMPMCARCAGLDFTALVREMVSPAVERFLQRAGSRRT
ncbi:MAG TPA: D-alanine--D-alanine ligase [Opitutaceae bacterium]